MSTYKRLTDEMLTILWVGDIKDQFYDQLTATISNIPIKEQIILLGDFNARVGGDQGSWHSCLGKFTIGKMNDNGQRLLELCTYYNLCPPKLLSLIESFHTNMQGTVHFNGGTSEPFNISSDVKQGCVLAPTLFGIFFALLETCVWHIKRGDLPAYKVRWQAFQSCPPPS